jgi:hypothetical protein
VVLKSIGAGVLLGVVVRVAVGTGVLLGEKVAVAAIKVSVGRRGVPGTCVIVRVGAAKVGWLEDCSKPIEKVPLHAEMNRTINMADKARNFIIDSCLGLDVLSIVKHPFQLWVADWLRF